MGFYALYANMQLKNVFIQNLRKYRRNMGISQMKLAEMCGTSTSYIGQIEIGNRAPSLEMIEKIALALQIRPHLFFFIDSDEYRGEKAIKTKTSPLSEAEKEDLLKRLNYAIRKVVKKKY